MWHRIRQLWHALTANMTADDKQLPAKFLSPTEQQAFYAMDVNSQKHSVLVARTCLQLISKESLESTPGNGKVNSELLVRAALLHDIGKVKGDLSTIERVLVVVINQLLPKFAAKLSADPKNALGTGLAHALYIHYHHSRIGEDKATALGVEKDICTLIAQHHCQPYSGESLELTLLRRADNLH